jgi:linearmycin/streptolysin S transport system ATP-binding protein
MAKEGNNFRETSIPPQSASILEVTSLVKRYNGMVQPALDGLTLKIRPGEILGLLGPNGAGKTTAVSIISTILPPNNGQVAVCGIDLAKSPRQARPLIGLVPQEIALYEDLPAVANVELFGALYGLDRDTCARRAAEVLALVGLADRAREKPARFSGGMKRRLNIACGLVHEPDVLLLDEPTVGVDPQSRNAIFDNLEALRDAGKALVYTTHYMEEAGRLCDHIVVMDHGQVVASGTQEALRALLPARHRRVEVEGAVDDALVAMLAARGLKVRETGQGSLEDVFLHLTGRQLRD